MRTTIDKAGRIVVPKALRDELGLQAGQELEISAVDGRLEIETPPTHMWLERGADGHLVAATDREMPVLTAERVREVLEQVRR
ncbi:transcriptional regulator, AbrB family [Gaiella occulta]|uniref:Transcriptional regulator, AbrB family n=1 Tax=Gaiella occulta TaxID=1002870 RepID=A0A7M2YUN2_9ACTN|nr:AbrB/MazE/SpoVT family DNA-binding domain-containing protein [Gaiella occulta]RDI73450.1 transcriptional regulator, AbrB family [Gaiella occulta]